MDDHSSPMLYGLTHCWKSAVRVVAGEEFYQLQEQIWRIETGTPEEEDRSLSLHRRQFERFREGVERLRSHPEQFTDAVTWGCPSLWEGLLEESYETVQEYPAVLSSRVDQLRKMGRWDEADSCELECLEALRFLKEFNQRAPQAIKVEMEAHDKRLGEVRARLSRMPPASLDARPPTESFWIVLLPLAYVLWSGLTGRVLFAGIAAGVGLALVGWYFRQLLIAHLRFNLSWNWPKAVGTSIGASTHYARLADIYFEYEVSGRTYYVSLPLAGLTEGQQTHYLNLYPAGRKTEIRHHPSLLK